MTAAALAFLPAALTMIAGLPLQPASQIVTGLQTTAKPSLSPLASKALTIVASHTIVKANPYCTWFSSGQATVEETRHLVQQFSVFSNQFLLAQLRKVINAPSLDEMREGKEILANELGVVFKPPGKPTKVEGADPDLVSPVGSVEGGLYSHRAAHFEWLLDVGKPLGLEFGDLGKRQHGTPATLYFCDKLYEIYGSDDCSFSLGASFAIEHWANAGFWDDLLAGFEELNRSGRLPAETPLGFWRFHQVLEAQHASHTMDELEEAIKAGRVSDEATFERGAREMLNACAVFWEGLDAHRQGELEYAPPRHVSLVL